MQRVPVDIVEEIERLAEIRGRAPSTDAERRAARHLEQRLASLGRAAETDPVWVHPNHAAAHALHALLAIVASVLAVRSPIAGAALALVAALSAFGDLSGSFLLLRRLTGRRASQNVTSAEDGGRPGVLVLVARYDVAAGGLFSRRATPRRPSAFRVLFWAIVAILVCALMRVAGIDSTAVTAVQFVPTVVLIASVALLLDAALASPPRGSAADAAPVATVLRLAERYGGRLQHFDLWVVFPGATEALMAGMRAWIRQRKGALDPARTVFLEIDTTSDGTVRWLTKDGLAVPLRYHPELVRLCEEAGEGEARAAQGAGNALVARAAGLPAISLAAAPGGYEFCCRLVERLDREVGPRLDG